MPNTSITQWGLDYASSASPSGTLIAPKYWVPVYDSRIDGLIHSSDLPVSAFSACVNPSATAPTGEIIWNVDGINNRYALSDTNKVFILSGGNTELADPQTLTGPIQSQQWQINQLDGVPLAPHFSATGAAFDPANKTWYTSAAFATVAGDNTPVESGRDKYFQVIDYFPVSADAGDSRLRGMVKCRLNKNIGTVKFNKVALYITKYNASGVESPDEPVLFAECQLKTTVIKTSMGTNGFDELVAEVQIDLHSIEANWADVFFSTSGDYWSRVPEGVYYPERVGIGSFIDSILSPQASLHVRRTRAMVNLGITDAPVARFDFNDTNYHQIEIENTGLVHQTFESDYGHIGLYYSPLNTTIYPDDDNVSLGNDSARFKKLTLWQDGFDIFDYVSYGYLKAYFTGGAGIIKASDNMSMSFETLDYDPAFSELSYIEGADIRKKDATLINYTAKTVYENSYDYIIAADIDESDSIWYGLGTGQTGMTHINIAYALETFTSTDHSWLGKTGKVRIYGRGEIALYGPVVLDALCYTEDDTVQYPYSTLVSRQPSTLMVTSMSSFPANNIIIDASEADASDNPSAAWASIVSGKTDEGEYIILGRIRHSEDLRPLIANASTIGVPALNGLDNITPTRTGILYKSLHVDVIGAYYGQTFDASNNYAEGRVSTIYARELGTTEAANNRSRINRMAISGLINSAGFDFGYIQDDDTGMGNYLYPQDTSESYPTNANYPRYYGLWPKSYVVLGNRHDMIDTVIPGDPIYPTGKSTIDLIATRFMSMTNTLEFVEAFKIQGKYNTNPLGYFPGQNPSDPAYITEVYPGDALTMAGIHKTGTAQITLGDYAEYLDYAYIKNITANSLTLAGALTVGAVAFTKTTEWAPDQNTTGVAPLPAPTTDGPKSSIITDVISMPTNVTSRNYPGYGSINPINTVFLHYQFTNRVVTGYLDMVTTYASSGTGIIRPIYNLATPSCEYVYNNNNITLGANWYWKSDQTLTFTDAIHDMRAGPGTTSKVFNKGQYVIITTNNVNPSTYMRYQHASGENMMYGIVTDYVGSPYSLTIRIIYYRVWNRNSGLYPTIGSMPLTDQVHIITAMPFLLPPPNNRINIDNQTNLTDGILCERHLSRYNNSRTGLYSEVKGVCFSDIGIDANASYGNWAGADTIQQFTYLTIKPDTAHSIDLAL